MPRSNRKNKRRKTPVCPYCGKQAVCSDSSVIYGRSRGFVWVCPSYPECDSYVGCHKGTRNPLGIMANRELRRLKMQVHRAFDTLWKSRTMTRTKAYTWLANELRIPRWHCHIGMFDEQMCRDAIEACANSPHRRIERYVALQRSER